MIRWAVGPLDGFEPINIGKDSQYPWSMLGWDYQHGQIPIPGLVGMYSESVRGVYEGMKLLGPVNKLGKINPGYFVGSGRERRLVGRQILHGWSYRGRRIDLTEARIRLLLPAYVWVLRNKAHAVVAKVQKLSKNRQLCVYDGIDVVDIGSPGRLSMAAVLVSYLNDQFGSFVRGDVDALMD